MVAINTDIPTPTSGKLMGNWGKAYTTEQVARLSPPKHTDTHKPKDHHTLFDMVSNGLHRAGFQHSEPLHYVGQGRVSTDEKAPAKFMTVMNIRHEKIADHAGGLDVNRQVFIQNSYDKSLSIQIITGIEVCICTNGMTMGQVEDEIRRKQTKNIDEDIYKIVYGGIDKMLGNFLAQDQRVKQLQNTEMTNRMADHIIMDCMRAGVINPAGVKDVWDKWDTPNYAEYKDRNAWSLANAFTERGRGRNIFGRHGANSRMLDIIDSYTDNASRRIPSDDTDVQPMYTADAMPVSADF